MADAAACAGRVARLRKLMEERGYDAVILRNNPDLRWLTGAERVFDDEVAHTAFITADGQWLHTDSRYANTFRERLGADTPWQIDEQIVQPAAWAAERAAQARSRVVAVEDTCDLAFYDAFLQEMNAASAACLTPRLHADICDLRMVKDAEEVELMRHAQSITDAAFEHICGFIKPGLTEQQIRVDVQQRRRLPCLRLHHRSRPQRRQPPRAAGRVRGKEGRHDRHGLRRRLPRLPLRHDAHGLRGRAHRRAAPRLRRRAPGP